MNISTNNPIKLKKKRLTFIYSILQLNSFPATAFLFASFSPFTVTFFPLPLPSASPAVVKVPRRSTAPRICNNRPWKDDLSRASYAATASLGDANVT
jgi:hypothetical protein